MKDIKADEDPEAAPRRTCVEIPLEIQFPIG